MLTHSLRTRRPSVEALESRIALIAAPMGPAPAEKTALLLGEQVELPHWVPIGEVPAIRDTFSRVTDDTISSSLEPPVPADGESVSLIDLDDYYMLPQFAGYDGSGYSIAVLDTGFDVDHPVFGPDSDGNGYSDRIAYDWDFIDNDTDASTTTYHHGT